MRGMRNIIAHGYFELDFNILLSFVLNFFLKFLSEIIINSKKVC